MAEHVVLDVADQPLALLGTVSGTFSSSTTLFSSARTSACNCSSLSDGIVEPGTHSLEQSRGGAILQLDQRSSLGTAARADGAAAPVAPWERLSDGAGAGAGGG